MLHLDLFHFILAAKSFMFERIPIAKCRRHATAILSVLWLIIYIGGILQVRILHSLVHDHEEVVSHSDDEEKDPCHRLIYHHELKACVDHDAHLTISIKCQMCDLAFHGDQTLLSKVIVAATKFEQPYFISYKLDLDSYCAVISSSRAPPILIS